MFLLLTALVFGSGSAFAQLDPALTEASQHQKADFAPSPVRIGSEYDLVWQWDNDPRWMRGREFSSGEVFFSSIARGRYFPGSNIGSKDDVSIDIVLSSEETTQAQIFRRDEGWNPVGVGTFPGAVYDVSDLDNPRRLNVMISEDGAEAPANMTWDPDDSEDGNFEYLWIMASDYDGTGTTYEDVNIASDADELDILYVWEGRLEPGRSFFETDPATLSIDLVRITNLMAERRTEAVELTWSYDHFDEAEQILVYGGLNSPASEPLATLTPDATSYVAEDLAPHVRHYFRVEAQNSDGDVIDVSDEVSARPKAPEIPTLLELLGTLNPAASTSGNTYGDIWGYVDPETGREYALLTVRREAPTGLHVIDVTEDTPVEAGFVSGPEWSQDVKTYDHYAYLSGDNAPIQIIDLSDPTNPMQVGTLDTGGQAGGAHNILIEGDYLYAVGLPSALRIFSLTDPVNPAFVSAFAGKDGQTGYHDVEVRNDTVYAAALQEGVDIIDVSDKSAPSLISTFIYAVSDSMGAHNVCSTDDGAYIFVGDEVGSEPWTRVFDARDPQDVEQVAEIIVDVEAVAHNCYVEDDLLYIAHYTEGVQVFDVTDPGNPSPVARYDTYTGPGTGLVGAWTAYPYLPSGKVIVSDMQNGLFVFEPPDREVALEPDADLATGFTLDAAYPNPSAGTVTVPFFLGDEAQIRLTVFDALGREVAVLAEGLRNSGSHTVGFNGANLLSGAYFYRLQVEGAGSPQTRPLIIAR